MRILAIDTSCGAASVAVVESGQAEPLAVMSKRMARGHADALAPMVEEIMRGLDGGFASLSRIAVATGPGSFTGIRIDTRHLLYPMRYEGTGGIRFLQQLWFPDYGPERSTSDPGRHSHSCHICADSKNRAAN